MPAHNVADERQQFDRNQNKEQIRPIHSEPDASPSNIRGGDYDALTPTHSTDAKSYTTEHNEDAPRMQQRSDFEAKRNRAASAPIQIASPNLQSTYSMSSTQSNNSKSDVHTSILSNGDADEAYNRDRKQSTRTLGRRRSRIKLNFAFWKKNKEKEEEPADGANRRSQGGPVGGR